jgi:DNA-binding beta-propeller fold protein YncE
MMRSLAVALAFLCIPAFAQSHHYNGRLSSYDLPLSGHPFAVVTTADGNWAFVALSNDGGGGDVAVIERTTAGYAVAGVVPLPFAVVGLALTHDGNLLVAAAGTEIYFLDVSGIGGGLAAVKVVGFFSDGTNAGSVWASITPDDRWLFICDENTGQVTVIDLGRARSTGYTKASIVGTVAVGIAPTDVVFSPDGSLAYVTVEVVPSLVGWPKACPLEGATDPTLVNPQGAVVVFNVATAVTSPNLAVTSTSQFVPAGCSPVRLVLSRDGLTLYVTARASNEVLALDTSSFASNPMHATIGTAPVGAAPVPVALIDSDALVVVGNSNRFLQPDTPQSLDIIDASKLRSGAAANALVRSIPAGAFPRALTLSPEGRILFVSNFGSNTLQIIDVAGLALLKRPSAMQ